MSAVRLTYLYCDHPECIAEGGEPFTNTPDPNGTLADQRALARAVDGWRYTRDGRDLCGDHTVPAPAAPEPDETKP